MNYLMVNENKTNFELNGQPFFYLADTVWSAFTNITMEEWEYYLAKRKEQGFNVLQINTMPQWDRCMSDIGIYPFATEDGQKFDFSEWNQEYYEHAKKMCQMAVNQGFQLALVVLWLNHVPGTWGSNIIADNVMPEEFISEYTDKIVEEFDGFHPIYIVSGDTDFDTKEAISYYRMALDVLKRKTPNSLKAFHIKRGYDVIPEEFLENIDFYMFQSGHNAKGQDMTYKLAESFIRKYPKKPIINSEPCYEQMGYSRQEYGRFQQADVRRAAWMSILSGACAGVTYGAHGVWNWQKINKSKNSILGEGFDQAFYWNEAIQFPGAWDYGRIKSLLEDNSITELIPKSQLILNKTEEIRMAMTLKEDYLIYLPTSTTIKIQDDLSKYQATAYSLTSGEVAKLDLVISDKVSEISMHHFAGDVLIILRRVR